jgi:hypothetical protein
VCSIVTKPYVYSVTSLTDLSLLDDVIGFVGVMGGHYSDYLVIVCCLVFAGNAIIILKLYLCVLRYK